MSTEIVICSVPIQIVANPETEKILDEICKKITKKAAVIEQALLAMSGKEVIVSKNDEEIQKVKFDLENYTKNPDQELGKDLYKKIMDCKQPRSVVNPLIMNGCKVGQCERKNRKSTKKQEDKIEFYLRKAIDAKLLPFNLGDWEGMTNTKYSAFQIAISHLKSWDYCNKETNKNYQKQVKLVDSLTPTTEVEQIFEDWRERNKISEDKLEITKKINGKFSKFEWDARLPKRYNLEELKLVNKDAKVWKQCFSHALEKRKLERLKEFSTYKEPDFDKSPKSIPYNENNYEKFSIQWTGEKFNISIWDNGQEIKLEGKSSGYFRDLKVELKSDSKIKTEIDKNGNTKDKEVKVNTRHVFTYYKGNEEENSKQIIGEVKEISLARRKCYIRSKNGKKKGTFVYKYYIYLPLNITVNYSENTDRMVDEYFDSKDSNWSVGDRILSVDLGITTAATCNIIETTEDQIVRKTIAVVEIGETKNPEYLKKLEKLERDIRKTHEYFNDLLDRKINKRDEKVDEMVHQLKVDMNQLKRHDVYDRNHGVSREQLFFIRLYKKYISILQRATYFGKGKVETMTNNHMSSYKRHYKIFNNLKLDFRRKCAVEIVRVATKYNCSIIVAEDLSNFLPDSENKTTTNELLMVWGHGQIKERLKHAASQAAIRVVFIDPRSTSQIIKTEDGKTVWGCRYGKDFRYIDQNQQVIIGTDADQNAAINIGERFFTKGLSEPFVNCTELEEGGYVVGLTKTEEETNGNDSSESWVAKRKKFQNKVRFGFELILVDLNGKFTKITKNQIKDKKLKKEGDKLYNHEGYWFPSKKHYELTRKIKETCFPKKLEKSSNKVVYNIPETARVSQVEDIQEVTLVGSS